MGKKTELKRMIGRQRDRRSYGIRRERERDIGRRLTNQRATDERERTDQNHGRLVLGNKGLKT